MQITVSQKEDQVYFVIDGDIDEVGAEEFKRQFQNVNLSGIRETVIDFADVEHIGSVASFRFFTRKWHLKKLKLPL